MGGLFDTLLGKPAAAVIEGKAALPNAFMEKQKKAMQLKIKESILN